MQSMDSDTAWYTFNWKILTYNYNNSETDAGLYITTSTLFCNNSYNNCNFLKSFKTIFNFSSYLLWPTSSCVLSICYWNKVRNFFEYWITSVVFCSCTGFTQQSENRLIKTRYISDCTKLALDCPHAERTFPASTHHEIQIHMSIAHKGTHQSFQSTVCKHKFQESGAISLCLARHWKRLKASAI